MTARSTRSQHLTRDELLDLVNDLGTAAERAAWLQHARSCSRCEGELRRTSEDHVHARIELPGVLETLESEFARGPKSTGPGARLPTGVRANAPLTRRVWMWGVGAAAALAVAVLLRPDPGATSLRSHLRPLPGNLEHVTQRDVRDDRLTACLDQGIEAYVRGNYGAVVRVLEGCDARGPAGVMRDLYLGSALAYQGRYAPALRALGRPPRYLIPEAWRREVDWTCCVASFGAGRVREGDSLLALFENGSGGDARSVAELRRAIRGHAGTP